MTSTSQLPSGAVRAWWPVLAYCALIFLVSAMPSGSLPADERLWRLDKLVHAVEYAILAVLLVRALLASVPRWPGWVIAVLAMVMATGYGVTDELHQSLVPGRDASGLDLLADAVGAVLGVAFAFALRNRWRLGGTDDSNHSRVPG